MRTRTENTKKNIVVAANSLFLDKGYAATSVDDIANKAGVAKQTVYGYFTDKRSLFTAVIERAVGTPWRLQTEMMAVHNADDLRTALYAIFSGINKVSMRPRYIKLLRVIVSEASTQPELGELFRNGVTYRSLRALAALFTRANNTGFTNVSNPELTARFFLGGIVVRLFLDGLLAHGAIKKFTDEEMHEYVDTFVQCLMVNNQKEI